MTYFSPCTEGAKALRRRSSSRRGLDRPRWPRRQGRFAGARCRWRSPCGPRPGVDALLIDPISPATEAGFPRHRGERSRAFDRWRAPPFACDAFDVTLSWLVSRTRAGVSDGFDVGPATVSQTRFPISWRPSRIHDSGVTTLAIRSRVWFRWRTRWSRSHQCCSVNGDQCAVDGDCASVLGVGADQVQCVQGVCGRRGGAALGVGDGGSRVELPDLRGTAPDLGGASGLLPRSARCISDLPGGHLGGVVRTSSPVTPSSSVCSRPPTSRTDRWHGRVGLRQDRTSTAFAWRAPTGAPPRGGPLPVGAARRPIVPVYCNTNASLDKLNVLRRDDRHPRCGGCPRAGRLRSSCSFAGGHRARRLALLHRLRSHEFSSRQHSGPPLVRLPLRDGRGAHSRRMGRTPRRSDPKRASSRANGRAQGGRYHGQRTIGHGRRPRPTLCLQRAERRGEPVARYSR